MKTRDKSETTTKCMRPAPQNQNNPNNSQVHEINMTHRTFKSGVDARRRSLVCIYNGFDKHNAENPSKTKSNFKQLKLFSLSSCNMHDLNTKGNFFQPHY